MVETFEITRDALRGLRFLPDFSPIGTSGDWLLVECLPSDNPYGGTPFIANRKRRYADALSAYKWCVEKDTNLNPHLLVSGIDADYEIWHVVPSDDEVLEALRQLRLAVEVV